MGDGRTDRPTNRPTDGRTQSLIEVLFAPKNCEEKPWSRGAEHGKKLISKVRKTTKNVKKYHGLGGAESGK
jgi:hypothetical protein